MTRNWITPLLLSLATGLGVLPTTAGAETVPWLSDNSVGPNRVVYTLELTCSNTGFVCDLIDGYLDQDISMITGAGSFELDGVFQFDQDSSQDVGGGLQPAYLTMAGSDVVFANIPFAGVPQITDVLVFALSNPVISASGFHYLIPGDYPFTQTMNYSGSGTVYGNLEFVLGPAIIVPPGDIEVSGILRVLGDIDQNGSIEIELADVIGSFSFQNITTIGGETVIVDITADITMNLAGEAVGPPVQVPLLGSVGLVLLVFCLLAAGAFAGSRWGDPSF